ncbi:MAG: Sua5/YciO/YrdC/YwlC family protein [Bacteroidales bacterium]|nr:Sua5/YciO/YrdC/YwlC family protein [Bacteroidales bacterium]
MKKTIDTILSETLQVLREGGLILYPTDTVWGIGCDATNPEAVAKVYALKQRSDAKALVLLAASLDQVGRYVKEIPDIAIQLVEVNDRPMTLIYPGAIAGKAPAEGEKAVPDRHFIAWNAVAEDGSVGIRIPMMEFCRNVCFKLGRPIVSTSANLSGEPTPTRFAEIAQAIKEGVDYVVEPWLEQEATGRSSQILKVGLSGEIEILRK